MHALFVHPNFPAQFRYVAPRLALHHGWDCTFLTCNVVAPDMPGVTRVLYELAPDAGDASRFQNAVAHARGVYEALKAKPDIRPDLVVAHGAFGSSLFLPFLYDAPIVNFFEYFYRPRGQDLGYRPDEAVTEALLLDGAIANAMTLLDLANCDRGWCPTEHQKGLMPAEYQGKIDVVHDGIDAELFRPRPGEPRQLPDGTAVDPRTRIVTYVSRGLEMLRGFDVFMEVADRIGRLFPDVLFVVAGGDQVRYGSKRQKAGHASFRERVLAENTGRYDLSRFHFTGFLPRPDLAQLLSISDLHVYLTVPFIPSWSVLEAMSAGCVLLASDQACVRDFVRDGENGLLCDFFDPDGMAKRAVEVLKDPAVFRPLGEAARRTIEQRFSIPATFPRIKAMFESVVATGRKPPSVRAADLIRPARRPPWAGVPIVLPARANTETPLAPFDGSLPYYPCGSHEESARGSLSAGADLRGKVVLFAWELGGGLGHLGQMLPLATHFRDAGCTIHLALRDLDRAAEPFGRLGVRFLQAPAPYEHKDPAFRSVLTFTHVLANNGFDNATTLSVRVGAWRRLMDFVKPDLIVFDHAPTALVASRAVESPAKRVVLGSGFCVPPPQEEDGQAPWAVLRLQEAESPSQRLLADERKVLSRVNVLLTAWGRAPLDRLSRLYSDVDETLLTTFPELDHFAGRSAAAYWGPVLDAGNSGAPVEWPAGNGQRTFVYLKPSRGAEAALTELQASGRSTLAYVPGLPPAVRRRLEGVTLRFVDRPLDLAAVARECELAVLNGGHGTVARMLLAGVPLLLLPGPLEQKLTAGAVTRLGAGEAVPARDATPQDLTETLEALASSGYRDAAATFAARYNAFDPAYAARAACARMGELLGCSVGSATAPAMKARGAGVLVPMSHERT